MTNERMRVNVGRYYEDIKRRFRVYANFEIIEDRAVTSRVVSALNKHAVDRHALHMLAQIQLMLDKKFHQVDADLQVKHQEKLHRWYGFVQSYMWQENYYTIDELMEHNRSEPKTNTETLTKNTG